MIHRILRFGVGLQPSQTEVPQEEEVTPEPALSCATHALQARAQREGGVFKQRGDAWAETGSGSILSRTCSLRRCEKSSLFLRRPTPGCPAVRADEDPVALTQARCVLVIPPLGTRSHLPPEKPAPAPRAKLCEASGSDPVPRGEMGSANPKPGAAESGRPPDLVGATRSNAAWLRTPAGQTRLSQLV